jgi:hypothetical protein
MCQTDLIAGLTVGQEVIGTLMELLPIHTTDAVDHQVIVNVIGIHMGSDHHLEA